MAREPSVVALTAVTEDQQAVERDGAGIFTKVPAPPSCSLMCSPERFLTYVVSPALSAQVLIACLKDVGRGGSAQYITASNLYEKTSKEVLFEAQRDAGRVQQPQFGKLFPRHKDRPTTGEFLFFAAPPS